MFLIKFSFLIKIALSCSDYCLQCDKSTEKCLFCDMVQNRYLSENSKCEK